MTTTLNPRTGTASKPRTSDAVLGKILAIVLFSGLGVLLVVLLQYVGG